MNLVKTALVAACCFACTTVVNAQSEQNTVNDQNDEMEESTSEQISIPESYQKTQDQLEDDNSSGGTSTYNIDETTDDGEIDDYSSSESSWRDDGSVEVLNVYSGSHDGNNVIKKIEVKIPESAQSTSRW